MSEIACIAANARFGTNLVRRACCARMLDCVGSCSGGEHTSEGDGVVVEGRCAGELHNDAVKVAAFLARTNRLRTMHRN